MATTTRALVLLVVSCSSSSSSSGAGSGLPTPRIDDDSMPSFEFFSQESNPRRARAEDLAAGNPFAHAAQRGGVLVHPGAYAKITRMLEASSPGVGAIQTTTPLAPASASSWSTLSPSSSSSATAAKAAVSRKPDEPMATASEQTALHVMRMQPSAIWIDSKAKLYGPEGTATAQGALASAARRKPSPLVVFVLYNLCAAHALRAALG